MILMTDDREKLKSYITDIKRVDEQLITVYADKSISTVYYSEHNLNVVRYRMIEQVRDNVMNFYDYVAKKYISICIKNIVSVISSVVGLFFLYNIDINIIMKIIISILTALGVTTYIILNKKMIDTLNDELNEAEASEFYVNHLDELKECNKDSGNDEFVLPIEDISKYNVPKELLEELLEKVQEFKEDGISVSEMKLVYKPKTKSKY